MHETNQVPNPPGILRDGIHATLLARLTKGEWKPGKRLSIDGLARELEVSPTPVREAMVALERSGLIEYRSQRGYIVAAPLNPRQIKEFIDARLVLEKSALSRALSNRWPELLQALRTAHRDHEQAASQIRARPTLDFDQMRDYFLADIAFHRTFFEFCENEFLAKLHADLHTHTYRIRQTWDGGREGIDFDEALDEHNEILKNIAERNHDGALAALTKHLLNVRERSQPK